MDYYLIVVTQLLLALQLYGYHLANYDERASSSSFGEPIFRLEPPSVVNFANSQGATILCLVSGSPRPTVTWYTSATSTLLDVPSSGSPLSSELKQSRPVGNVTNLRQISHNGQALRLLPFKETDFRPEIHSTEYRCVASNQLATIHSRSVLVQPVISTGNGANEVKVSDEFVALNQVAVFKCRSAPNSLLQPEFSQLAEWFTSDGLRIEPGETSKGNKFTAFKSGELHVNQVEMSDLRRTYGCRLRNTVTGQLSASSGLAQLIATSDTGSAQQRAAQAAVLHTINQLIGDDSLQQLRRQQKQQARDQQARWHSQPRSMAAESDRTQVAEFEVGRRLLLPCAIRSRSTDGQLRVRWLFQAANSQQALPLDQWAAQKSVAFVHSQPAPASVFPPSPSPSNRSARFYGSASSLLPSTRFFAGPTHLLIEWPTRAQAGRYVAQVAESADAEARSACDINVIIRRPIELSVRKGSQQSATRRQRSKRSWLSSATRWLFGGQQARRTRRQSPLDEQGLAGDEEAAEEGDAPQRGVIRVRGAVDPAPMVRVGQRLQLECRGSGHPIESVKWFRNGQLVNAQTSADLHLETMLAANLDGPTSEGEQAEEEDRLLSTLLVRQVQPKEVGLNMFECFAWNSLGDRARAGIAVLLIDRGQLDWARSQCPVRADPSNTSLVAIQEDAPPEPQAEDSAAFTPEEADAAEFSPIRRLNPLQRALVLEGEPLELVCPGRAANNSATRNPGQPHQRVEWRRLAANTAPPDTEQEAEVAQAARNFNQLFVGGDSRFVINGSSLQIRAPAKRHDEALYVCRNVPVSQQDPRLHQSSLAAHREQLVSCDQMMESALFRAAPPGANISAPAQQPMSSISIRIVAKPKIDPFEFSRNLEEGMRAVVVCAVISGQSPVDITWFKDGNLLLADEQLSVDQANGFSSSLTFHRIKSTHSGLYTCVAANAFASANHTSQLLVNVAPYLIDPPKSTRAILGSNVLVNCRAGGQPSPQIRWRKLVPIGPAQVNLNNKQLAPPGGLLGAPAQGARLEYGQTSYDFLQSDSGAPTSSLRHSEFRIVTSNSHIQVLENGSMIIKEVELGDASRYVCQAFNGISPSLSEVIELQVLQPAQFEVNYETISVKRDSSLKFNCAPRGDQPMQIEWRKEDNLLAPLPLAANNTSASTQIELAAMRSSSKYLEVATYNLPVQNQSSVRQRHSSLALARPQQTGVSATSEPDSQQQGVLMSELHITYADRSDSGTFVCVASNAYGKDERIYRLIVQESPDAPVDVQLRGGGTQPDQLKLHWTAAFDGNLPLSHFVVEYRRVLAPLGQQGAGVGGSSSEWTRLLVNVDQRSSAKPDLELISTNATTTKGQQYSVQLRQLQARSHYQARVAAVNAMGQSAYSQVSTAQTAEEPPTGRPDDLRAEPVSSTSLKVLWRGPQIIEDQAPIKGYYVSHRKASNNQQVGKLSESAQWIATSTISAGNRSIESGGRFSTTTTSQPAGYDLVLSQLEKNTRYEIRVQPYNSMGTGPSSETLGQTLKFDRPAQPTIKLVAARRQALELKWFISDDQPLMGFSLFYKCEYDDWQEIQLGLIYHYVIENLRCGNKYQIYLSAFNQVGRSDPSDVLSVRTEGTAPVPPDKSQFFRANISELVLDMRGWKSGGCPISSFMIQFKRMHDTNWFVLSEGQTPFTVSDKITIPDLAPATWYKLLVTALNEAGSTNAEYLFSTLTTSGEQIAPTFPLDESDETGSWPSAAAGGGKNPRSMFSGLSQLLFAATGGKGNQDGGIILLPFACILLLLLTTVASYLYYSRYSSGSRSSTSSSSSSSTMAKNHKQQPNGSPNLLMGQMTLMHGASNPGGLVVGCSSFANDRSMRCNDEKQLIIEGPGSRQQTHHMLADTVFHPSPPSSGDSCQQQHQHQQQQQHAFDALLNNTGHLQTFNSAGAAQRPTRSSHGMRLLSSGHIFNGAATSSSVSTHSTNCNFDGSSVQGSSSNASSAGKTAKLQLIDESSLISAAIDESMERHPFVYANQNLAVNQNVSPAHQQQMYSTYGGNHVDVILSQVADNADQSANEMYQHQMIDANSFADIMTNQANPQLYASSNHQRLSNSFASGADLRQRQATSQQTAEEPIYQRLENFQTCGLPTNNKQNCFARAKSQTLRFNHNTNHFNSFDNDNCDKFAQTLQRQNANLNQRQEFTLTDQQNAMCDGGFYPAGTVHQQVQPPPPLVGFNQNDTHHQNVIANEQMNANQQQQMIYNFNQANTQNC